MKDYLNKICWLINQKNQPKSILRNCLYQAMNLWMGLINKLKLAVSIVSDYSRYKCDIDKLYSDQRWCLDHIAINLNSKISEQLHITTASNY